MKTALRLVERGLVPTPLIRRGIRRLLEERLAEESLRARGDVGVAVSEFATRLRESEVAILTDKANEQHYELPPEFFSLVLGAQLKYSSAYFPSADTSLDEAEELMLTLTAERAGLEDGQDLLELGCGWGSLTFWMAERFPNSRLLAVSNSAPQRAFIEARARERGLQNLTVLVADMNHFRCEGEFDRIVSVEMFEHMRNWEMLLGRFATWLRPEGRVFLHVFAHRLFAYPFEVRDDSDWMSRWFFSGGVMPSVDLLDHLDLPFEVEERHQVCGQHYARTAEAWLERLEARRDEVLPILAECYGADQARTWYHRWRVFFLACAELFGYDEGREWVVVHQRLRLRESVAS